MPSLQLEIYRETTDEAGKNLLTPLESRKHVVSQNSGALKD